MYINLKDKRSKHPIYSAIKVIKFWAQKKNSNIQVFFNLKLGHIQFSNFSCYFKGSHEEK